MITIIVRCIIIYLIALLVIRVMGKRQIAQMQPFELVITLIIADLATIPMADNSIPLINGIVSLVVLCTLHFIITFLSCKFMPFRRFFNGKPLIMVNPDGVVENCLDDASITINDIIETCRNAGYPNIEDVLYVIMETNGKLSVIPKNASSPPTQEDLKISKKDNELPNILISDGKLNTDNLERNKISDIMLESFLKTQNTTSKDVIVMLFRPDGNIYLQKKGESSQVLTHNFENEEASYYD